MGGIPCCGSLRMVMMEAGERPVCPPGGHFYRGVLYSLFMGYLILLILEKGIIDSVLLGGLSHLRQSSFGLKCSGLVSADSNKHRVCKL